MPAPAYREHHAPDVTADVDPMALARSLAALRQELRTLASDFHAAQRENAMLRQELGVARERNHESPPPAPDRPRRPEVQRFKQELEDQLERLRRAAATHPRYAEAPPRYAETPPRYAEAPPRYVEAPPREPPASSAHGEAAWLKRMMIFMMMTELA